MPKRSALNFLEVYSRVIAKLLHLAWLNQEILPFFWLIDAGEIAGCHTFHGILVTLFDHLPGTARVEVEEGSAN
ncbi:MAG: hypothetical protein C5B53_13680, partial [Candidatus Melainabacteria bacterium]